MKHKKKTHSSRNTLITFLNPKDREKNLNLSEREEK